MRIAVAGISHEALTWSPVRQTLADFTVWRGSAILRLPGLADAAHALGIEIVPVLVAASRCPAGLVEESAYVALRDELLEGLRQVGRVDGICLVLHGAMLVENIWSGETDQVRTIRAELGYDVPVVARLDPHANLTEEFANKTDTWVCFRTAPHADQAETLRRALAALVAIIQSGRRPCPVFIRVPLLLPGERATTRAEPMRTLLGLAREIEASPGIVNAEVVIGFGWGDAPHAGASVVVTARDDTYLPAARREARRLAQALWDRRHTFTFDQEVAASADEAIDRALAAPEPTVFVSDAGDNPTAGAPGDATHFLARLLARNVPDAVVAGIPDREAVVACLDRGVGSQVSLRLGGKMDRWHGAPVALTGRVEHCARPETIDGVAFATVRVDGVRIIISSHRYVYRDLHDFRRAGVDPLGHKLVMVKLGYLMAPLRAIAPREILALTPGYTDLDLARLPYKYVTRPVLPLDADFTWFPAITNTAAYGDESLRLA
jgi:microcystin degradation protein MlrC